MYSILLVVIYLCFISLGLPDSLLGSAWPSMYQGLGVPLSYAGIISVTITVCTVISSLFSDRMIRRFGTGKVTTVSVLMTALALFGFSVSTEFWMLCLLALPFGLGAGSVDAALNNFVALHYKAKHMNWLHCFWGIGATAGPYIMGVFLTGGGNWSGGYGAIALIQIILTGCLVAALPLWKRAEKTASDKTENGKSIPFREALTLSGAASVMVSFFCYCALEASAGMWASSYIVIRWGITAETAAKWAALFYLGITAGRFFGGFITVKLNDNAMIRLGEIVVILGIAGLLGARSETWVFVSLVLVGIGCAPIFPSLLHATPDNFGKELSQSLMGMQMACAYMGSAFMPPLFGILAQYAGIKFYPIYLAMFAVVLFIMTERLSRRTRRQE